MKKKLVSALLSASVLLSSFPAALPLSASAADSTRQVEYLDRGTVAVRVDNGVFLSWRLLGTESLDQTFDLYRDGELIEEGLDTTNYTDTSGFAYQTYQVVPTGEEPDEGDTISVWDKDYYDIPLNRPAGGVTKSGESYTYSVNDTSVADVDGDGEYEFIIKWDPSNSHDNSDHGYTGNVLLDCYEMDGTQLWRIDLGINIRAGAHYTQFIVYDFDGDGKAEMALRTAPGSKDSTGAYVSTKGKNITWDGFSDTDDLRQSGSKNGHIIKGPDWLTMFNGETGEAMQTVDFYPQRGSVGSWGDNYGGRSERFLAAVAYLNGTTPSLIVSRGYYEKAGMAAYNWDGENFTMLWSRTDTGDTRTLYGQGNHNISVTDADNDGKDEIVFGSTVVDDNGSILNSTGHGHGDAMHVSDFDNDGNQEVFQVHESSDVCNDGYAAEYRRAGTGEILSNKALAGSKADNGRGVMANIDDNTNDTAEYWSAADSELYGTDGVSIGTKPRETNSLLYWDGDLARELLDITRVVKYGTPDESGFERRTFEGVHSNNSSKSNAALSADIMGDWREEVMFGTNDDTALRIFTTTIPTEYKLTTLMHDTQYRCGVAWQNVGYNQPPHTSYYIGKAALSQDGTTLSPKAGFDTVAVAHTPETEEPPVPAESTTKLIDTKGFTSGGEWSFSSGSVSSEAAPFNEVFRVTSGTSTMDLGLSPQSSAITVESFELETATAVVKNNSAAEITPALVMASYNAAGELADVSVVEDSIASGQTATITGTQVDVPADGYAEAMLWNGLSDMSPIAPVLNEENPSYVGETVEAKTLKFSFDWKASNSSSVQITGAGGENIITLVKPSSGSITYQAGTSEAVSLPTAFASAGHWYHVEMTEDPTARTIDLSIQDYTDNSDYRNIYAISFASAGDVSPANFVIKNSCSIDNLVVEEVVYNVERALIEFNVTDANGSPVADATVTIGTRTLTTDASGHAAIKLETGEYDYKITKPEYKSASGKANAATDVSIDATLLDGEERTVYTSYYFGDIEIAESKEAGKAKENTTFTVPDSAKIDVTHTFPTSAEDLPPGYEDYAGQTMSFEFDPDQSNTVDVTVGENSDTYIRLYYKEKRVPVTGLDTEIVRVQFAPSGLGHEYWTATAYDYADNNGQTIEVSGSNSVTINFPTTAEKFVMEYDMIFKEMDWGGNVFGISLNNGNTVGSRVGLRASSENTGRWEPVYNGEQYITLAPGDNRYPGDYTNQRVHFIIVSDGTQLLVTIANAETGELYVDNFPVPYANNIGPASKPINRVVFGRVRGSGNATYALTGFKAYTIGAAGGGDPVNTERTVVIPSTESFALTSATHISDVEGVDYNAATLIGVEYELRDASGNVVSPAGITLGEDGTLTIADNAVAGDYYVVTLINDTPAESCKLSFLKKTELFKSSFRSGTDGFIMQAGDTANTSMKAEGGTLEFRMNNATADGGFYKIFDTPVESGKAELTFTFTTGGLKDGNEAWNWDGSEYTFYLQILDKNFDPNSSIDNKDNIILELSQAYRSSAQQTLYRLRGTGTAQVGSDWKKDSSISDNPVGRSSTTWNITANMDFDTKTATFTLKSKDYEGYTLENVSLEGIDGVGAIRVWGVKDGNMVRWRPTIKNVVLNRYIPQ